MQPVHKAPAAFSRTPPVPSRPAAPAPIRAGVAYWAVIFALGFMLGTVRTVWGAQALGETRFILIEVPIMLTASWLAARRMVRRFAVTSTGAAAGMGALAFALLMLAELTLTGALAGSGEAWGAMRDWAGSLLHPPGIYGFAGQIAFGVMPVVAVGGGGTSGGG